MKYTRVSDEMLFEPESYLKEWQKVVDRTPAVSVHFHDVLLKLYEKLDFTEDYYHMAAKHLVKNDITPQGVDANLLLAIANELWETMDTSHRWWRWDMAKELKPYVMAFRTLQWNKTVGTLKVPGEVLMLVVSSMGTNYGSFTKKYTPETEDDLYSLVSSGTWRHLSAPKKNSVRTILRKNSSLIENTRRFLELNEWEINEAVLSKMPYEERKSLCKEMLLAGVELKGIPMSVYAKGSSEETCWMIQSDEWTMKDKIRYFNGSYRLYKYKECFLQENLKWKWGRSSNPVYSTNDYYGPLLFPKKIVLDFGDKLNSMGMFSLVSYLSGAPLKIQVKLGLDSIARFNAIIDSSEMPEDVKEHVRKHLK